VEDGDASSPGTSSAAPLRLSFPPSEPGPVAVDDGIPISPASGEAKPEVDATDPGEEASRSALQGELSAAVKMETGSSRSPTVAVEQTGEGMMISLTDDMDFGMFSIGSAQPQPEMVRIMERIAAVLKTRSGSITIRGHTDARPFRTAGYDNWRLSTDRAQMAYYMLVRGGLDEKRVVAIEGYADRRLKKPGDPEAAENRRIEILLGEAT
jgi:chemotaxis protein MotB